MTSRIPIGRPPVAVALALLAIAVWGCGSTAPSSASPSPTAAPPSALSSPAAVASSSPGPLDSGPASGGLAVAPDPMLLQFLPGQGLTLTYDAESTAQVARDPTLAGSVSGLAIALVQPAAGTSSAPPGSDLAVVSVIRVRDTSFGETWFRDYRDSYDDAACANAGGVTRHAQTMFGQTTVYIGSCAGGSFTYHARVEGGTIVVSVTSVGSAKLGQQIMEGLGQ